MLKHREEDLKELGIRERWSNLREYFEILGKKGIALNFATLVGHGNLRACVAGYEDRKPERKEMQAMKALLKEAIAKGAIGMSTGLIYPPGVYSKTDEIIQLCKSLREIYPLLRNIPQSPLSNPPLPPFSKGGLGGLPEDNYFTGIYTTHMRSEGENLLESIEEAIKIGRKSRIKVHISHIKTSGKENWHKIDDAISMIEDAQKNGIRITSDRYPYTAASTDLDTILPPWAYEGGMEEELKRLKSSRFQKKMKKEMLCKHPEMEYWEGVIVASVSSEKNRWMEGKSIAYIAHYESSEPIDIFFKILIEERLRVGAIFSSMNEDNLRRFLSLPYVMIGTDSSSRCTSGPTYKGKPHPRGFGSFPRFLGRYVRDNGVIGMSEAIHKITMLPAKTFDIDKRGVIRKGAFADLVIFDLEKIIDRATFDEPFLKPEGICYVIVNGLPAVWKGKPTGINAGRVLRHGK